jgi:mRNA interferase HigB
MRIIARSTLVTFWQKHPESKPSLERWYNMVKTASWHSMQDVTATFASAKNLNRERARFEIAGGNYRLIAAFDFKRQTVYVKFVGSHAEYDAVDALTVSQF